jgi:CheY-like chemotaxis protein
LGAEVDKAEDGRIAVEMVRSMLQRQRNAPPSSPSLHPQQAEQSPLANDVEADSDRQVGYDFVLMDNLMPHMTGVEACRTMRQIGYTGVIFGLTGNAFEQEIAEYLAQGANAVFKKPLVLNDLFCALRRIEAESKA